MLELNRAEHKAFYMIGRNEHERLAIEASALNELFGSAFNVSTLWPLLICHKCPDRRFQFMEREIHGLR